MKDDDQEKIFKDEMISLEKKVIIILENQKKLFQSMHSCLKLVNHPEHGQKSIEALEFSLNKLKYGNTVIQKWLASRLPDEREKFKVN